MAIQQHPLPQDISGYRFRLIGDMTIKQFAMLAGGIIISVLFYSSPLPFFFKYPLAFLFLALGIGSAFVPVQGRPLEQWIIAFIKSIYSPTQYIWKQTPPEEATGTAITPNTTPAQNPPIISTPPAQAPAPVQTTTTVEPVPTPAPPPITTSTAPTPFSAPTPPASVAPISTPTPSPTPTESVITPVQSPAPTTNLPIPFTPTTPNTLVGLTLTPDNKILESVLVEILSNGLTIRATKSNRLGQFMFARPLEKGLYQIAAEKNGFKFSTYSIELTNKIVPPLKIQAESGSA